MVSQLDKIQREIRKLKRKKKRKNYQSVTNYNGENEPKSYGLINSVEQFKY